MAPLERLLHLEILTNEELKDDAGHTEVAANSQREVETSQESVSDAREESPSLLARDLDILPGDSPIDASQNTILDYTRSHVNIRPEVPQISSVDSLGEADTQVKDVDLQAESVPDQPRHPQPSTVISAEKVQEQLDEAQGLLKNAISTGQSKEARFALICAGLSSRLQEYKCENAQLEGLLTAERELSKSYEERIEQLQKDLSVSKSEVTRVESSTADALVAKNAEIEALVNSLDASRRHAALSEGNLASLQANMETIMRNRELTETRMVQALREELAAAERRAEDERAAYNATKMAAMEREVELEHRAVEASTALARIQRTADERASKAGDLEQKVALLEVECASLNQELQDMEVRARRGQKKSHEDANQAIQIQAWQEEVERARQGQRDAESRLSSMEAEVQKMRVEMAAMKKDAEHYSREVEAERNRVSRRASASWEETLPLHHRHMVGASRQLEKAVKLIDSGAVRVTKFLWRYPTARVILLFYLEQADTYSSREVAESMGLMNQTLP